MSSHTLGPWRVSIARKSTLIQDIMIVARGERIARVVLPYMAHSETEYVHNAILMAHAPELLDMLIELTDMEGPQPGTSTWGRNALALIARAKGVA